MVRPTDPLLHICPHQRGGDSKSPALVLLERRRVPVRQTAGCCTCTAHFHVKRQADIYQVHRAEVPHRAVWTIVCMAFCIACVNFGPVVGFNAIISLTTVALLFSYLLTISCVIWRRLFGDPLPRERFTLGKWGLPVNIVAWLCVAPLTVISV